MGIPQNSSHLLHRTVHTPYHLGALFGSAPHGCLSKDRLRPLTNRHPHIPQKRVYFSPIPGWWLGRYRGKWLGEAGVLSARRRLRVSGALRTERLNVDGRRASPLGEWQSYCRRRRVLVTRAILTRRVCHTAQFIQRLISVVLDRGRAWKRSAVLLRFDAARNTVCGGWRGERHRWRDVSQLRLQRH